MIFITYGGERKMYVLEVSYLLVGKTQLMLQHCFSICQGLDFIGQRVEGMCEGCGELVGRRAHAARCRNSRQSSVASRQSGLTWTFSVLQRIAVKG